MFTKPGLRKIRHSLRYNRFDIIVKSSHEAYINFFVRINRTKYPNKKTVTEMSTDERL